MLFTYSENTNWHLQSKPLGELSKRHVIWFTFQILSLLQILSMVNRDKVNMYMRYAKTFDNHPNTWRTNLILEMCAYLLNGAPQHLVFNLIKIPEMINLPLRNDESMPLCLRMDVKKCNDVIILIDLVTRNFTFDNLRKNRVLHTL